jgi:hypothetical protein
VFEVIHQQIGCDGQPENEAKPRIEGENVELIANAFGMDSLNKATTEETP